MERTFIIEGERVSIPESKIKKYFKLGYECFNSGSNALSALSDEIYASEDGLLCDGMNCSTVVPVTILNDKGKEVAVQCNFHALDQEEGFMYNNKLYFCDLIEEV